MRQSAGRTAVNSMLRLTVFSAVNRLWLEGANHQGILANVRHRLAVGRQSERLNSGVVGSPHGSPRCGVVHLNFVLVRAKSPGELVLRGQVPPSAKNPIGSAD